MLTISLRTSTLIIAFLGLLSQVQIVGWLNLILSSVPETSISFPHSASSTPLPTSTSISNQVSSNQEHQKLSAVRPLPSFSFNKDESLEIEGLDYSVPPWEAEAALKELTAVQDDLANIAGNIGKESDPSNKSQETKYHLPWFHSSPNHLKPETSSTWQLFNVLSNDQIGVGKAEREKKSYDVARFTTKVVRFYVIFSMGFCLAGVLGAWKSNPFCSRLFVIHSFLDLILCTASMVSIAILCSYPSIKISICDVVSSGEFNSLFSPTSLNTEDSSVVNVNSGTHSDRDPNTGELNTFTAMFDAFLSPENCFESFGSFFVPILLLIALVFTSIRLKMFFTVHSFYNSLIIQSKTSHSHSHSKTHSHHHHHHHHNHHRTKSSSLPLTDKFKMTNLSIEKQA